MARKHNVSRRGTIVDYLSVSSRLKDNPLGDPHERVTPVYLPAEYDDTRRRQRRYPVLFDLVGYTGSGHSHTNWKNFEESVPEKLDRLIEEGKMPPCIVVFPDCFTALGGNQYINSSAVGAYADYLTRELIPQIDTEFRSKADREHRACFGKSSGGYGAIVHGMLYSRYWGAIGNHSGDCYFDFVYRSDWPAVLTTLQRFAAPELRAGKQKPPGVMQRSGRDDGRIARFLEYVWTQTQLSGSDITALMLICMAATYDPDPQAPLGFRVPYDLHTGELIERRWQRWLNHDPLIMLGKHASNLKKLKGIYIDCGWRDQFHIHFGTRQLSRALSKHRVEHRYEEFDGTHSGIDHRMDISLPFLARCIR